MKVRISGRAAAFAIERADGWELGKRGRVERHKVSELDVTRAFGCPVDVIEIDLKTVAEIERRLEVEWSKDRGLRLTIMLFDPNEIAEGLSNIVGLIERLLENGYVIAYIENQFSQRELPLESESERARELASDCPILLALITRVLQWQPAIQQVTKSFEALPEELFGGLDEKAEFRELAIAAGAFRTLVAATDNGKLSDAAIFELHDKLHVFRDARKIVQAWASSFERVALVMPPLPKDFEHEFEDDVVDFGGGVGGHQRLWNALAQQRAILERVADGDYDNARKFARELSQLQLASGGQPYLVKSLTRLSQHAREMEAFELELEWAYAAVETQPGDPRARTQYADALLQADRFEEALAEFTRAGELGERGYAATGFARTMRLIGQFQAALDAYSEAAAEFKDSEHEIYALVGVANVKSDMGDAEGALNQIAYVVEKFPDEAIPRVHYATLLMRLGRFEEAWSEFVDAEKLTTHKIAALNGLAQICRKTGRLDEARRRFGEVAYRYPRDVNAHIGLIDTLRQLGEGMAASMYARRTAERFPGSPRAAAKYAETASELGRHSQARQILTEAIGRFPKDSRLITVRVNAFRREGRYDRALATIDAAVERFPYNRHLRRSRAEMLRRAGDLTAAEQLYRLLVEEDQADTKARNGLASLLVLSNQWDLAKNLIGNENPTTSDDWRSFLIKATLIERQGSIEEARERFSWAMDTCPFAAEQRLFTCALALQSVNLGQARRAPKIVTVAERDIGNIIDFQVAAITGSSRAKTAYSALSRHIPARFEALREEIARSYGVSEQKPKHNKSWITRRISEEFLLAAA